MLSNYLKYYHNFDVIITGDLLWTHLPPFSTSADIMNHDNMSKSITALIYTLYNYFKTTAEITDNKNWALPVIEKNNPSSSN